MDASRTLTNTIPYDRQLRTFIGSTDGKEYVLEGRRELLESVVYNILAHPIQWQEAIAGCWKALSKSMASKWTVRPFGQSILASSLVASLQENVDKQVTLDEDFGKRATQIPQARQFPIAIVGMAGRFPKADNVDALWSVLQAGLGCHTEVSITITFDESVP